MVLLIDALTGWFLYALGLGIEPATLVYILSNQAPGWAGLPV